MGFKPDECRAFIILIRSVCTHTCVCVCVCVRETNG